MSVDRKGGSVLVVDDDPGIVLVLGDLLEDVGYTVSRASDGMEALEGLRTRAFELMLTDLSMPRLGGHELIERTATLYPKMLVIAMTAAPSQDAIETSFDEGVHSFLIKPFASLDVVLEKVATALRAGRLRARISGRLGSAQRLLRGGGGETQ